MAFFVTRLCFYRSRLYFLLMSTKNIDRASIDGSIGGDWDSPVALARSFASLQQYLPCEAPVCLSSTATSGLTIRGHGRRLPV
jgi:hypothetical protein